MSPPALLTVGDLVIEAGRHGQPVRLVDGFNLTIAAGERVALVGESGSGKSVLARSIMALTPGLRVSGSIVFEQTELLELPEREMRRVRGQQIGMVFQDPMAALNPLMTVGAQIAEPLRSAGLAKRAAHERARVALEELGIANAAKRMAAYPHEFSGGMRQRVAIAIALAAEPALLIADEPTTALDVRVQEQVLDLLDEIASSRGLAVLLITHDLAAVAGFSDRVVVMYAGRQMHEDGVEALFTAPAHPYTAALLAAVPRLDVADALPRAIPGAPPNPTDRPSGCPFHPRCSRATDICATSPPELRVLSSGATVACHWPVVPAMAATA
jgi:oligopeptide/dipeptide ABC transporter ATP-binding protein